MLLNVLTLSIITICLHCLVFEDQLQVYCFGKKCSMVDFIERLDEVGLLFCLASIFVFIAYLRIELISTVISFCCGLPQPQRDFPRNRIGDHTGDIIFFLGVWSVFLLRFHSFLLCFLLYHFLTAFVHSGSESFNLLLCLVVFLTHIRGFLLDSCVYMCVVLLQVAYIHTFPLNNHVHQRIFLVYGIWWLLGRF